MFKTCRYYVSKKLKSKSKAAVAAVAAVADDDDETETIGSTSDTEVDAVIASAVDAVDAPNAKKMPRAYIPIDKAVLQAMDAHIIILVLTASPTASPTSAPKPSECYTQFYAQHADLLTHEIARLERFHEGSTHALVSDKIKKTYKNRMFAIQRAH